MISLKRQGYGKYGVTPNGQNGSVGSTKHGNFEDDSFLLECVSSQVVPHIKSQRSEGRGRPICVSSSAALSPE